MTDCCQGRESAAVDLGAARRVSDASEDANPGQCHEDAITEPRR